MSFDTANFNTKDENYSWWFLGSQENSFQILKYEILEKEKL